MDKEKMATYDVVNMFKDIHAMRYVCPLVDSMSTDEKLRFSDWIRMYIEQSLYKDDV
jgi:hypothetical protein